MLSAALRNRTTRSALVCERIGGVKLKLYSGSFEGRNFQPLMRSQKKGSPGLQSVADGKFEIATCAAVSVGVVKLDGLMDVVCDRPDGRIVPYLVEGASLSTKMIAPITLRPETPMVRSSTISKRCFGSWRSCR